MKKKIIISLLTLVMCFMLTGCGESKTEGLDDILGGLDDLIPSDQSSDPQPSNPQTSDYTLKSTDNQLVLTDATNTNYSVFSFENNILVKYETVIDYGSAELASYVYNMSKTQEGAEKISQKGQYIVVETEIDEFSAMTKEEIEEAFKVAGYTVSK